MNLRELVTTLKGRRTYIQLAADCGGYPSDKRLQQLATQKQKNFVDPKTVKALARGLRVDELAVVLAAAEDLGLDVSRAAARVLDYLPAGVNDLDEQQLFAIGNMLRSFIPEELQDEPTPAEIAAAPEVLDRLPDMKDHTVLGIEYVEAARGAKSRTRQQRDRETEEMVQPDEPGPDDGA